MLRLMRWQLYERPPPMATEWFVIDTRTNEIVNCITTDRGGEPSLDGFEHPEHHRVDRHPPMAMLERYRYWNERP